MLRFHNLKVFRLDDSIAADLGFIDCLGLRLVVQVDATFNRVLLVYLIDVVFKAFHVLFRMAVDATHLFSFLDNRNDRRGNLLVALAFDLPLFETFGGGGLSLEFGLLGGGRKKISGRWSSRIWLFFPQIFSLVLIIESESRAADTSWLRLSSIVFDNYVLIHHGVRNKIVGASLVPQLLLFLLHELSDLLLLVSMLLSTCLCEDGAVAL